MATHADLRARDAGERRFFDRGVAIAAIDAVIADVVLVAERHRLLEGHLDVGGVGRPENGGGRPAGAANKKHESKDDDPGVHVGAPGKDLGHAEAVVSLLYIQRSASRRSVRSK